MKKRLTAIIAIVLAFVMALVDPVRILADTTPVYISEIKVGMGKKASEAEKALEGYTIVTDDKGNKVDFNDNAGGGLGSKGDKVVYIGIKTTTDRSDAITDIALMNMKGGYSTEDYDALMEKYIDSQIAPFVESFMAAIREYRENYNSSNPSNKARAHYIHDALNKFTDDDCNNAPLGDLLLAETRQEMGDAAYNALSAAEKAKHADLVTIVAQSNGKATLMIENLLVRAADTADTTWIERVSEITYDDLLAETGLARKKAIQEVEKLYSDDAGRLLEMWDTFKAQLEGYDEAVAKTNELKDKDYSAQNAAIESFDIETSTEEQTEAYMKAIAEITTDTEILANATKDVICKELLENVEYDGGTLLDLFLMSEDEINEDITVIYPLVASLSDGQRAGLEFLTLEDLVELGGTDENGYKDAFYDDLETESIYEGVNRDIYEPGGVGLTSDALRAKALENLATEKKGYLSALTYAMIGITATSAVAFAITLGVTIQTSRAIQAATATMKTATELVKKHSIAMNANLKAINSLMQSGQPAHRIQGIVRWMTNANDQMIAQSNIAAESKQFISRMSAKSATCSKLSIGLGVAMVVLIAITTYLSYRDMVNHYKVEFTPIPRYMVDEKDITALNAKGETIVIKNQAAYYTAALCNRGPDDEFYGTLWKVADLNGDVGQQWLALYYAKNDAELPILADSLKVVIDDSQVPSGYTKGVHMFGVGAAENINNTLYVWNSAAKSVYLYYMPEEVDASVTGSVFTAGNLVLSAGAGLGVGALVSGLAVHAAGKKKKEAEE